MFEYFQKFVGVEHGSNRFWPVDESTINEAERRMGIIFPSQLRQFFREVGCGFWGQGVEEKKLKKALINRIPSPQQIAELMCDDENPWRPYEGFIDGTMPFFDVGENTYLVLRPNSEEPNRVYWPDGIHVVSDTLQDFFRELYRHAGFYKDT